MSLAVPNRIFSLLHKASRSTVKLQFYRGLLVNPPSRAEQAASEDNKPESEHDKLLAAKDQEIEAAKKEAADFKDKYIRSLAEKENIMKRNQKFLADAKLYAVQSFSKDLLEISDVLERATESVSKDELKSNKALEDLFQGLTMTYTELHKVFSKHGLEKEDPMDQVFDPNFHEAVFQLPDQEKKKGTVAVVQKTGYRLHGRTVRPALVGVVQ